MTQQHLILLLGAGAVGSVTLGPMLDKLVELLKQFWRFLIFFDTMPEYEGGVVLRLGKYNRDAKPGWNWIWPFMIEKVLSTTVVAETMVTAPQSLLTKDGKALVISTVITFTKPDPKLFLLTINGGDRVIEDAAYGVISELIMKNSLVELGTMDVANELSIKMRRFAKRYGVEIQRVQIADFTVTRSLRLMQSVTNSYATNKEF